MVRTSRSSRWTQFAILAVALPVAIRAQSAPCPLEEANREIEGGWRSWRAGRVASADSSFRRAVHFCDQLSQPYAGLGYVALRRNRVALSLARFDSALARNATDIDALRGRGLAGVRAGDWARARDSFERVLRLLPADAESRTQLRDIPAMPDTSPLPRRPRPVATQVDARTGYRRLEVPDGLGGWKSLWIKAVNIGAALPGKHPSEFPPDDSTYERWLSLVSEMGGNAVRVYTIHPPHFYRALERWNNEHPQRPLWLLHGVWTELPPGAHSGDYDDPVWAGEFRAEMQHVVDLLHGHALIRARAGHASGRYAADVSRWTLGYIIGREWEPYSVLDYTKRHPRVTAYEGRYVSVQGGNAMDAWLARFCDALTTYEMQRYNAQRPVAYTNWPTLDPLTHPTESTRSEEAAIQHRRGEVMPEGSHEYDNDAIGLDGAKMRASAAFPAGVFASYHAYPYYPDFLVLDSGYARAASAEGSSAYFGYLRALVDHFGSMPLVISEYGVPSSRGIAHVQPQGWNHGGHSETQQAAIDARLTKEIFESGAAGAGLFALIDEWFKKNWIVVEFEQPLERKRLWLNPLDAEEHYGVIAMRAGMQDSAIVVDGQRTDWRGAVPLYARDSPAPNSPHDPLRLDAFFVRSDEAYIYLRLDVGAVDWARAGYLIGIDTYRRDLGDRVLPRTGTRAPVGLEFVVDLHGPEGSHLLVDHPYNPYTRLPILGSNPRRTMQVYHRPFRTRANNSGVWDTLFIDTNRRRFGRDGTEYLSRGYDRNLLLHARQTENSLADWFADPATGTIEVRLPWGMLNVLDPSSHRVLFAPPAALHPQGVETDGFRFVIQSYDPSHPASSGQRFPRARTADEFAPPPLWTWRGWEQPRWYAERKPLFNAMRAAYAAIPDSEGEPPASHRQNSRRPPIDRDP